MIRKNCIQKSITFSLLFLLHSYSFAQELISVGQWRSHYNYYSGKCVASADNKIFYASENGFFYLDLEDNSYQYLSHSSGLSDYSITCLTALPDNSGVYIGYDDGNLDVFSNGTITNYSSLKDDVNQDDKQIYHMLPYDGNLYISTGFGTVVLNTDTYLVKESLFQIGPEAQRIQSYSAAIFHDSLFIATQYGIITTSLDDDINRQDYTNWYNYNSTDDGIPSETFKSIVVFQDSLYALSSSNNIYQYNSSWSEADWDIERAVNKLIVSNNQLILAQSNGYSIFDGSNISPYSDGLYDVSDALIINNDTYIADAQAGLIQKNSSLQYLTPESLPITSPFKLVYANEMMHSLSGGFSRAGSAQEISTGMSRFEAGYWTSFSENDLPQYSLVSPSEDWTDLVVTGGKTIISSFNNGLVLIDETNNSSFIDAGTSGTTLQYATTGQNITRISAIEKDDEGNIWMNNYGSSIPLHKWDGENDWEGYTFNDSDARYAIDLKISPQSNIWMSIGSGGGNGMMAYDPVNNIERRITTEDDYGELPSNVVTDYEFDIDGILWITTESGVAYIANPSQALAKSSEGLFYSVSAILPIYDGQYLFRNKVVNCIAIDGGNRKWIGTQNGVWLFDEDVTELLKNFTTDNSALPDNDILDIEINELTGEIFFTTSKGLVSFRSEARTSSDRISDISIYPNPIRRGYSGVITIDGLVRDTLVKITDISGNLVYETYSNGGRATWDGLTTSGIEASNGVYLVMASNSDGSQKIIGKIAISK